MPELAADLVSRRVAVIVATSTPVALAAKNATATIPIAFTVGADAIRAGLVSNFSRPDGNLTGVTRFNVELAPKRGGSNLPGNQEPWVRMVVASERSERGEVLDIGQPGVAVQYRE